MYGGSIDLTSVNEHRLAAGERPGSLLFGSTLALRYAYGHGRVHAISVAPLSTGAAALDTFRAPITIHKLMLNFGSTFNF